MNDTLLGSRDGVVGRKQIDKGGSRIAEAGEVLKLVRRQKLREVKA